MPDRSNPLPAEAPGRARKTRALPPRSHRPPRSATTCPPTGRRRPGPHRRGPVSEGPPMPHKISLLIRADIDLDAIELIATGCLTEQTAPVLLEQIARAR